MNDQTWYLKPHFNDNSTRKPQLRRSQNGASFGSAQKQGRVHESNFVCCWFGDRALSPWRVLSRRVGNQVFQHSWHDLVTTPRAKTEVHTRYFWRFLCFHRAKWYASPEGTLRVVNRITGARGIDPLASGPSACSDNFEHNSSNIVFFEKYLKREC